ncbi:hypothetical protein, partial [Stutzerimonas frequens]|uniref:hypothetical protein n=1 Tax=Stutzerimonas frequens TaxID=2968969 RepID=UPI0022DD959E
MKEALEEKTVEEKPVTPTLDSTPDDGDSKSVFALRISEGQKDALQLGIKRHFLYTGSPDPGLWVEVAIEIDRAGRIVKGPVLVAAGG